MKMGMRKSLVKTSLCLCFNILRKTSTEDLGEILVVRTMNKNNYLCQEDIC